MATIAVTVILDESQLGDAETVQFFMRELGGPEVRAEVKFDGGMYAFNGTVQALAVC